jgi:hypothetical protein
MPEVQELTNLPESRTSPTKQPRGRKTAPMAAKLKKYLKCNPL